MNQHPNIDAYLNAPGTELTIAMDWEKGKVVATLTTPHGVIDRGYGFTKAQALDDLEANFQ